MRDPTHLYCDMCAFPFECVDACTRKYAWGILVEYSVTRTY